MEISEKRESETIFVFVFHQPLKASSLTPFSFIAFSLFVHIMIIIIIIIIITSSITIITITTKILISYSSKSSSSPHDELRIMCLSLN